MTARWRALLCFVVCSYVMNSSSQQQLSGVDAATGRVSYVLEPFASRFNSFVSIESNTVTENGPVLSLAELAGNHSSSAINSSLQGALIDVQPNGTTTTVTSTLHDDNAPYSCFGADTLQFRYSNRNGFRSIKAELSLLIDPSSAVLNVDEMWFSLPPFVLQNSAVDGEDGIYNAVYRLTDLEVAFPVATNPDHIYLRLDRIRGWRIQLTVIDTPLVATVDVPVVQIDRLECIGYGDMFGNAFRTEDTYEEAIAQNTWIQTDSNDEDYVMDVDLTGTNSLRTKYKITHAENWGGFVAFKTFRSGNAHYDLSECNEILFDVITHQASTAPGRTHLRFLLHDGHDCVGPCPDHELYYSFLGTLDNEDDSRHTLARPLNGTSNAAYPFYLTGWAGGVSNSVLDKDIIVGFTFELSLDEEGGAIGSEVLGELEFGNLTASPEITTVGGYAEYIVSSVLEKEVEVFDLETDAIIDFLKFKHQECDQLCDQHPECLYNIVEETFCTLVRFLSPEAIHLASTFTASSHEFRSLDSVKKRGEFCTMCHCNADTETIDCTDRDLRILPKVFSASWAPKRLILGGNPKLVFFGETAFESVSSLIKSLESIVLPRTTKYIHPNALSALPLLQVVSYEENELLAVGTLQEPVVKNTIIDPAIDSFLDVCCVVGEQILGLSFCRLEDNYPGVDSVYLDFIAIVEGKKLLTLKPDAALLSEATTSPDLCGGACALVEGCNFFTYDGRINNAFGKCSLFSERIVETKFCCDDSDYADANATIPGYTSGISAKARHAMGARVAIEPSRLNWEMSENRDESSQYQVSLATMPLRGAVWIEPEVVVVSEKLEVTVSPSRVILYDNSTVATITVQVKRKDDTTGYDDTIFITNNILSCDTAFSQSDVSQYNVVVHVSVPQSRTKLIVIVSLVSVTVLLLAAVIAIFFCGRAKRLSDDAWMINADDLVYDEPPMCIGQGSCGMVYRAQYRGTDVAVKKILPDTDTPASSPDNTHGMGKSKSNGHSQFITSLSSFSTTNRAASSRHFGSDVESGGSMFGNETKQLMFSINEAPAKSEAIRRFVSATANKLKNGTSSKQDFMREKFIDEMQHLAKLRHPAITTVIGAVINKNEPQLVLEYMMHGSLQNLVMNRTIDLSGDLILQITRDIAQGVRFLHASAPPIVHGDLKGANILLDSRFHAKVSDFGLVQKKQKNGICGTLFWMAPELLRGESKNTPESDVYSMGIILYEMYGRSQPYKGEDWREVVQLVVDPKVNKRPPTPSSCPHEVVNLMTKCLAADAFRRPNFEDIDLQLKGWDATMVEPVIEKNNFHCTELNYKDFPIRVEKALRDGRKVEPETIDSVTLLVAEICNFKDISSKLKANKLYNMLERLFNKLQEIAEKHCVHHMKTNDDTYMFVSNLATVQDEDHVSRMAEFATDIVMACATVPIDVHHPSKTLSIRVGMHSGPVVASVVGHRYCLFGETVNHACRLLNSSSWNRVLCSEQSKDMLAMQLKQLRYERSKESHLTVSENGLVSAGGPWETLTFWVHSDSTKRMNV